MVVQKLIDDYFKDIKMIVCPTIRAKNGLCLVQEILYCQKKQKIFRLYMIHYCL